MYIHIYIYRERERVDIHIYIYIYIHTYIGCLELVDELVAGLAGEIRPSKDRVSSGRAPKFWDPYFAVGSQAASGKERPNTHY